MAPQLPPDIRNASKEVRDQWLTEWRKKEFDIKDDSPSRDVKQESPDPADGNKRAKVPAPSSTTDATSSTNSLPSKSAGKTGTPASSSRDPGIKQENGQKRANPSPYADDRRGSAHRDAKRRSTASSSAGGSSRAAAGPAESASSASSVPDGVPVAAPTAITTAPAWYNALTNRDIQPVVQHQSVLKLRLIRTAIGKRELEHVMELMHDSAFIEVNEKILRASRILHSAEGLPRLFDPSVSGEVEWPEYARADAKELYYKWCRRVFDTDLLRGITLGRPASDPRGFKADTIKTDYTGRVNGHYFGNGNLVNGQWWPTQLCTVRDGAHSATIAGICGTENNGAYSVIMSGGTSQVSGDVYPDKDEGNTVLYCGTDSTNGEMTANTFQMMKSLKNQPVRLIRSHKVNSQYAPKIGFRYDGLYDVVESFRLDPEGSTRQRHQFKLVRCEDQAALRYEGPAKRPTNQEIKAHEEDRKKRGYKGA